MKNVETSLTFQSTYDDPEAFTTLISNLHCKQIVPQDVHAARVFFFLIKDKNAYVDSGIGYQNFTW